MASKVAHQTLKQGVKSVRPLLSTDKAQAKRRVLNLYKAWYRQIPFTGLLWPMTVRTSLWSRRWDLVLVAIFGVFICIRGGYKAKSDYENQISKRLYPGMLLSMHKHKQEWIIAPWPCRFNSSLNCFRDDPALNKRGLS